MITVFLIYLWLGICSGAGCYINDTKERVFSAVCFGVLWPILAPIFLFARLYGE